MRRFPVLSGSRVKLSVFGSRSMLYDVPKSSRGRNHAVMGGEMLIPACMALSRSRPVSYPRTLSRSLAATIPSGELVPYPLRSRTEVMSQRTDAALNGRNTRLLPLRQVRLRPLTARAESSIAAAGLRNETRSSRPFVNAVVRCSSVGDHRDRSGKSARDRLKSSPTTKFFALPSSYSLRDAPVVYAELSERLLRIGDHLDPVDCFVRRRLNVNEVAADRGVRRPSMASPWMSDCDTYRGSMAADV